MRAKVGETDTFYQHIGQKGPILVLLHGWGCDWQIWSGLIPTLADANQLIMPDLPGFGQTRVANIEKWDTPKMTKWLEAFLSQVIDQKSFTLIGHSFGGKVAAAYAATAVKRSLVNRLILIDSAGIPGRLTLIQHLQKNLLKLLPHSWKQALPNSVKTKLLKLTRSAVDYQQANAHQKQLLRTVITEDIRPILPSIKVPTTLIWGKNDQDTPVANAYEFHQLITESQLMLIEAGHFPFIDQPQQVIQILSQTT